MRCARRSLWPCVCFALLALAISSTLAILTASAADETLRNVGFVWTPREILFFSAPSGEWTAVRLDAGERILQRGADGNVAAVVTSERAIGFSASLNVTHELGVTEDEGLEAFKVEGNVATFLTRRRVFAFSAFTGKWSAIDRFQLGK